MFNLVVLFSLLILAIHSDYCESYVTSPKVFLTEKQTRIIDLSTYIQGHDLTFHVDDHTIAKIYSSFEVTKYQPMNLGDYSYIKSVDLRQSTNLVGLGHAALLAQKDNNKDIAIWVGEFQGSNKLPDFSQFRYFTLPNGVSANCFDTRLVNNNLDVVLNCQTIPNVQSEEKLDLFCYIRFEDTVLSLDNNCITISSLSASLSRKSKILTMDTKRYLLSANKDINSNKESLSYIAIYYINSNNQVVFNNIIDGLLLDYSTLDISDFIITPDSTIILSDTAQSRLVFIEYTLYNDIIIKKVKPITGKPLALTYDTKSNTLLVATKETIIEYKGSDFETIVGSYEVDQSDNLIDNIQVSSLFVIYITKNRNLFVYERQEHKVNYLLHREQIENKTHVILSQDKGYLFTINAQFSQAVSISQPYLQLSAVTKNQTLNVTALSTTEICQVNIDIGFVEDTDTIASKQTLGDKGFLVDPLTGLLINLDTYYGGANLQYDFAQQLKNRDDFDISLNHINNYVVASTFAPTEVSTILSIDTSSFYYIGINSVKESKAYIDICAIEGYEIKCTQYFSLELETKVKQPILQIKAKTRTDGNSIVVWSYKNKRIAEWININKQEMKTSQKDSPFPYSSIHINEDNFIFISKTGRFISIQFDTDDERIDITPQFFNKKEYNQVQNFYPRQILLDSTNSQIFYVKFPSRIAKFIILNSKTVKYLGIDKTLKEYVIDKHWTMAMPNDHIITFLGNSIIEEYYNPTQFNYITLQSIEFLTESATTSYDKQSQIITLISAPSQTGERVVKFLKTNQGSMGLQYAQIKINGQPVISGNWLLVEGLSPTIYYVNNHPVLSVKTNLPEQIFKKDVNVTIYVKSKTKTEHSKTQIEAANFPTNIQNIPDDSNIVKAPCNADNIEIVLPVQNYFSGSIADYSLECPFCDDTKIHLFSPLREDKSIEDMSVIDFVKVGDGFVALQKNTLYLMNGNIQIITSSLIKQVVSCSNLQYNQEIGLLLFCISQTGQEILYYEIQDNMFLYESKDAIHGQHAIRNFDEMFVLIKNDKWFLLILDNDQLIDSNYKKSAIKVFDITYDLNFIGEWNSKHFGTQEIYPINDLDIYNAQIFVTLGNLGLGYGTFTELGILAETNYIQLYKVAEIKDILLDNSYFKQLQVIGSDQIAADLKIFITSTSSLSMIISLNTINKDLSFKGLHQAYFRYGNQRLLNWHAVTSTNIYLSYYDEVTEQATIVSFIRSDTLKTQFKVGIPVKLSKNMVKYHQAFITNNQLLLVSHLNDLTQSDRLVCFRRTEHFSLMLNYQTPGDFKDIKITATNKYNQAAHSQKIQFDSPIPPPPPPPPPTPDNDDGIKWYVIVIVSAVVFGIVGVSYILLRIMKRRRSQQSSSLLTEKEVDLDQYAEEDGDENNKKIKKSIQDTKYTSQRVSINADDE